MLTLMPLMDPKLPTLTTGLSEVRRAHLIRLCQCQRGRIRIEVAREIERLEMQVERLREWLARSR